MKISTGLQTALLSGDDLIATMNNYMLKVYKGTVPADADAAISASDLLHTYTVGSVGGTFEATPVAGAAVKKTSETLTGTVAANGTASCARLVLKADHDTGVDDDASTSVKRIQFTVGTVGTDFILSNLTFTASETRTLNSLSILLPTE